jgi:hypothetical protein
MTDRPTNATEADDRPLDESTSQPTFPAPPEAAPEDVDLDSWEWPGQQPLDNAPPPTETAPGQTDGLIPLADETPEYRLADAPPQEGYTVPDRLSAPRRRGGRKLAHWCLAAILIGGLAMGASLGWQEIKQTWADFEQRVSDIREEGNQNPLHRELVEKRLEDPTKPKPSSPEPISRAGKGATPGNSEPTHPKGTAGRLLEMLKGQGTLDKQPSPADAPPSRKPAGKQANEPKRIDPARSRDGYTLQAIVNSAGGNLAMINGQCVRQGQRIDGATLENVSAGSVTLRKNGRAIVLELSP